MEAFTFLLHVAFTIIVTSVILYVGAAIYNVTLHPLARFPGPTIYGASILPAYFDLCRGESASTTLKLHEEYGAVVRMTPNDLSFNTSQAWRDIYGYRKGHQNLERDPRFFYVDPKRTQNIIASNEANHGRMRRVMIHAFSESALREQESLITTYCDLLIRRLSQQSEAQNIVDLAAWLNYTSFDIIGDLTFGESFHALDKGEDHWWMSTIFNSFKVGVLIRTAKEYMTAPFGRWLFGVLEKLPAVVKTKNKFRTFIREKTLTRLSMKTERRDLTAFVSFGYRYKTLTMFARAILRHNDNDVMSERELAANAGCLIIAGSESTATLLSGLIFHLHSTPRVLDLLQNEIRDTFKSPSAITFDSVSKLPYLQACIEEALRLYPPIPCGLPRQVPIEGMTIDGHFVPGNTSVSMHQLSTARSSRNFKDPLKFIPERWLNSGARSGRNGTGSVPPNNSQHPIDEEIACRCVNDDFEASQPFALGSRGCLGKNLAFAEMRSIMARLIWHFDMNLQPDSLNWDQQKVYVLWDKSPLNIRLSTRRGSKNPCFDGGT